MTDVPYRFISEGVSVGAEQGSLRSQEGPRHPASGGSGLLLQLAFQGGHLVEKKKNHKREDVRYRRKKRGTKREGLEG